MVRRPIKIPAVLVGLVIAVSPVFAELGLSIRSELKAEGCPSYVRLYRKIDSEPEVLLEQAWFDSDGRITERVAYDEDGGFGRRIRFTYNDAGDLTGWDSRDSAGRLQWRYAYLYDEDRRITQEISYDSRGNMEGTELYSYDDDQLVEEAAYTGEGLPQWRKIYEHDEKGERVEWAIYFEDGRLLKRGTKFNNPLGRVVRERLRDEVEDTFEEIAYSYDFEGRVTRVRVTDAHGDLRRTHEYEYDKHGNVILERERDLEGDTVHEVHTRYRYDHHANWIKRVIAEKRIDAAGNETMNEMRYRREIEYHDD